MSTTKEEKRVQWWVEIGIGETGWSISPWNVFGTEQAANECTSQISKDVRWRLVEASTVTTRRVLG